MKTNQMTTGVYAAVILAGLLLYSAAPASDLPANRMVWSETLGWINLDPTHQVVTVTDAGLAGFAWAENFGWIKFGADSGPPYANTASDNWGVNREPDDTLSGFAWSETVGWINFAATHGSVTWDATSKTLSGFAWAENAGWINLAEFDVIFVDGFEGP
jgi:hypothetical protein